MPGVPSMLRAMSRSKGPNEPKGHAAVRLDKSIIERIVALLWLYAIPGRQATLSDGLRAVVLAGLEVEERRAAGLKPPPTAGEGGAGMGPASAADLLEPHHGDLARAGLLLVAGEDPGLWRRSSSRAARAPRPRWSRRGPCTRAARSLPSPPGSR